MFAHLPRRSEQQVFLDAMNMEYTKSPLTRRQPLPAGSPCITRNMADDRVLDIVLDRCCRLLDQVEIRPPLRFELVLAIRLMKHHPSKSELIAVSLQLFSPTAWAVQFCLALVGERLLGKDDHAPTLERLRDRFDVVLGFRPVRMERYLPVFAEKKHWTEDEIATWRKRLPFSEQAIPAGHAVNRSHRDTGETLLTIAARHGCVTSVKRLCERKEINLNHRLVPGGETALYLAARAKHDRVYAVLAAAGADPTKAPYRAPYEMPMIIMFARAHGIHGDTKS